MALSYSHAKQIPIQDYLSRLGFEPDKIQRFSEIIIGIARP
jgi:hypothetical protein